MGTTTVDAAGSYTRYRYWCPSGDLRSITSFAVPQAMLFSETRPDRVRTRKPTGWLMPKPYNLSVDTRRLPVGFVNMYDPSGCRIEHRTGDLSFVWANDPVMNLIPLPPDAYARCVTAALLQLKDQRVNIGVALGEAVNTARTISDGFGAIQSVANKIGDGLTRVARAARSFKKGRWNEARRHLGVPQSSAVPRNWLALQYGWLPILSDIKGATDELLGLPQQAFVTTVKASVRKKDESDHISDHINYANKLQVNAVSGAYLRLDYTPGNTFLQTATRVGLTNPAEVAWELVPLSFVVDWALPIGDWLSALDAAYGWDFLSGSYSTFQRNRTGLSYSHSPNGLWQGQWRGGITTLRFNRNVVDESPLPPFPDVKNPLSLGHAANGFSLLASVMSGRK